MNSVAGRLWYQLRWPWGACVASIFTRFLRERQEDSDASSAPWSSTVLMQPAAAASPECSGPLPAVLRHLRTGRGNLLVAGATHVDMGEDGSPDALFALIPDANRQLVLLIAPDLRPLQLRGDGMVSPAISGFRLQTDNPGLTRLRHPLAPQRFLGVTGPGAGGSNGCVIFDSAGTGPLDRFEIVRADPGCVPGGVFQIATEICAAVAYPLRAATVLARLRGRLLRPALAASLLRVLPREELADLAGKLLEHPDDLTLLRQCMPDDPWFARVLPTLSAWNTRRRTIQGGVLQSPAADEFAGDPFEGFGQPQAGLALTALARATIRPTRGACLLTTVRNEGVYLLEWLAYHRSIGFEHAFIYTNDNTDASGPLLESLGANGVITLVRNEVGSHGGPQNKMHAHALSLGRHHRCRRIHRFRQAALPRFHRCSGLARNPADRCARAVLGHVRRGRRRRVARRTDAETLHQARTGRQHARENDLPAGKVLQRTRALPTPVARHALRLSHRKWRLAPRPGHGGARPGLCRRP
jgi:hypothetical protein